MYGLSGTEVVPRGPVMVRSVVEVARVTEGGYLIGVRPMCETCLLREVEELKERLSGLTLNGGRTSIAALCQHRGSQNQSLPLLFVLEGHAKQRVLCSRHSIGRPKY